ncbi:bifunctional alpha/beta hydrolase/class I SAM-dependent methyltransferase [Budviciaceae bacterium BWR-B9]|uniref:Bifunctional alpha/beta hydrolase/class I SAM-dependent methyltransferase n=1 Tax=Limnobaculum allomyrinae TaxID=2791986 RepID=A0ABS1IME7_9GAMM|nr:MULTISPECIES: bifunctional alpha/beta hydrolase/class I SAM-dependent methyltransferase [Limnobaculum]MBK5142849.1 bifunctional alpha/beta hydrolase/class I SAM-dependent methyltransferase [Limnobaculum allomyrinae]MBV7690264.1 bifunctional alpha/beta hydrolase/class I SAM-dependent methyltransferase [Limnobaculum sp. M2-1]
MSLAQPRTATENWFKTSDGTELFYRCWPQHEGTADKVIVLFHRGHEHSGRLQHIVDELNMPNVPMYAWDARGHGKTAGERGYSPSIGTSVRDVDEFVRYVSVDSGVPMENVIVIAQSVGAVLAATWAHDYAPKIRGLILASPAFKVKLYVPFARAGLGLMKSFRGLFYVNSYVKGKYLTHDQERVDSFNQDPLITRAIAVNILLELYSTSERIVADASAITIPTQLLISGDDYVVHHKPQHQFYQRLNTPVKEKHILSGFYHDTLGEKDRHLAFEKIRAFIDKLFSMAPQRHDYSEEDRWSANADKYRELMAPLPHYSIKRYYYRGLTSAMASLGKASKGVRLGFETGFDSGSTLDYVYRNHPEGSNSFGRFIDKQYLNSIGWRGIRQRKVNIETLIRQAIDDLKQRNMPVRIVDIAAGHGRYVLDAIGDAQDIESILLRDYSELNVEQGKKMIAERHLSDKAEFVVGNAFDRQSLAELTPNPTLGIVSGLYELFPENKDVQASLMGLADTIPEGGLLVYTGQPWHPQLEMIARSLTSHQSGKPWVMRCRTQGEMDSMVEYAGFEKKIQLIDDWGIFSVSIAVRVK